jgi:cytidine deaminase
MAVPQDLLSAALKARDHAYCPYSKYPVGAALRAKSGQIYVGTNVENASFGLTICAERNAIAAMIVTGDTEWIELTVVTQNGGSPCGACRQVLAEFCSSGALVYTCKPNGTVSGTFSIGELLPVAFDLT